MIALLAAGSRVKPPEAQRIQCRVWHQHKAPLAAGRLNLRERGRAWRAGGEARIARLKHCFDMARSRYRGESGMARTIHWAAIANNLAAIAARTA